MAVCGDKDMAALATIWSCKKLQIYGRFFSLSFFVNFSGSIFNIWQTLMVTEKVI